MIDNKDQIQHYLTEYIGEDHAINPFLLSGKFKVISGFSEKKLLDPSDFKVDDAVIVPKYEISQNRVGYSYYFDQERSCKVYQQASKNIIKMLTGHSSQLFLHLICHLTYGSDKIKF